MSTTCPPVSFSVFTMHPSKCSGTFTSESKLCSPWSKSSWSSSNSFPPVVSTMIRSLASRQCTLLLSSSSGEHVRTCSVASNHNSCCGQHVSGDCIKRLGKGMSMCSSMRSALLNVAGASSNGSTLSFAGCGTSTLPPPLADTFSQF